MKRISGAIWQSVMSNLRSVKFMSTPTDPHEDYPDTYFVQNRSNQEELTRLQVQDDLITILMGGALPEQSDPTLFHDVLDVGCGSGGWLIEAAQTYPSITRLVGVDVNDRVIERARAQAVTRNVSDRTKFYVMDALRMLEFPRGSFDLINQRSGAGYLRAWDWPKLLQEYQRVARPGGVIRITEGDWIIESSSPALTRLFELLLQAFYQAGHSFSEKSNGVTSELVRLLEQSGFQQVQTCRHTLDYRPGSVAWPGFLEDMRLVFRTIVPFFQKWTSVPEDYEVIYQQMLSEIQQPGFVGEASMLTAWGINPQRS